ncbi:hypothetical protein pEaSNUABM52_00055 [Erwinia phage pEp_SNUABM_52]|nr:hypothetical protein pEaSNUABM52_00055 [Erwinia phage pEp_SNUABM_52]
MRYVIIFALVWIASAHSLSTLNVSAENSNSLGIIFAALVVVVEWQWLKAIRKSNEQKH